MTQSSALIVIFEGVEEIEALTPVDCLRRAGVLVTVASSTMDKQVTGRNQIKIEADKNLNEALAADYDLVVIPGGPGHESLLTEPSILSLLKKQDQKTGWIGSICAGPMVLDKAGVLSGKQFTSFPATAESLPERDPSRKVVRDRNLVTAQGAGCSIDFALALVEVLCGPEAQRKIADSICA